MIIERTRGKRSLHELLNTSTNSDTSFFVPTSHSSTYDSTIGTSRPVLRSGLVQQQGITYIDVHGSQPLSSRLFFPRPAYIHRRGINFSYLSRRRRSIGQLITRDHWIINATAGLFSKRSTRTLGGLRLGIIRLYIYIRPFRAENPGVDLFHIYICLVRYAITAYSNALPTLTKLSRASRYVFQMIPCEGC